MLTGASLVRYCRRSAALTLFYVAAVASLERPAEASIVQQAYLKASNTETDDRFSWAIAVSGNTVVVGAHLEDSSATGIDGNQSDNSATNAGAVYVFVREGGTWVQQAYLKASNTEAGDQFGWSVAISDDTIVIGAPGEDSAATGVNGDQSNNDAPFSGAVYVFARDGGMWSQQAYLKASNAEASDFFGRSVGISGDTIVVGADGEDSGASGVNGDQSDNSQPASGAAYVFRRTGAAWSQEAYLKASNPDAADAYGRSAAISGDVIVVGAYREASSARGVNGDGNNNDAPYSGAAYVFARSGTTWVQEAYLKAHNAEGGANYLEGDNFGISVAVSGETVVVGAEQEDSGATGVNGDGNNNDAPYSGAAYVFVREGGAWSQQAYLKSSTVLGPTEGFFGKCVAVSNNLIAVGAVYENSAATGVNGDQNDNSAVHSGAAYVFQRADGLWNQQAYLKASNTEGGDYWGWTTAADGDLVVVGSWREDSAATGVNGDQSNNDAQASGAAYVLGGFCAPEVTVHPISQVACAGSSASLVVEGVGSGLTYQWRRDGVAIADGGSISGATTATLAMDPVGLADTGNYDCILLNNCGSAISMTAALTVVVEPPPRLYVKADAAGANDGSSWANAFVRLQDALAANDACPGQAREMWVAAGEYRPDVTAATPAGTGDRSATFRLRSGLALYGGFAGNETELSQRGDPAANPTILSGDMDGPGDLFFDSFDVGARPEWGNEVGEWAVINGAYRASQPAPIPPTRTMLPYELEDFEIELDVAQIRDGGIWLRMDSQGNGVVLVLGGNGGGAYPAGGPGHDGVYWHTVAEWVVTSTSPFSSGLGILDQSTRIRVQVTGARYQCFVGEGRYPASVFDAPGFSRGRVGLYDAAPLTAQTFDNVRVARLGAHHVVTGVNVDETAVLDGFTIRGGNAEQFAPEPAYFGGGAWLPAGADATIRRCVFVANRAPYGGALYVGEDSRPVVEDCAFEGNVARVTGGAVILNITGGLGRTIRRCRFEDNEAANGGAVGLFGADPARLVLAECTLAGNRAVWNGGAAIVAGAGVALHTLGCWFVNNSAGLGGGAISAFSACNPANSVFIANRTLTSSADPTVGGGALEFRTQGGTCMNCTFYSNESAGTGHCCLVSGGANVQFFRSVLLSGSSPPSPSQFHLHDAQIQFMSSTIDGGRTVVSTTGWGLTLWDPASIEADPLLVDPDGPDDDPTTIADNELRPRASSPCVDAGGAGGLPRNSFDAGGAPRFVDGDGDGFALIDHGAFEYLGPPFSGRYYVRPAAAPGGDGTSWSSALRDLAEALNIAAARARRGLPIEVWVAAGTYTPAPPNGDRTAHFVLGGGVAVYGGFAGNETELSQRDIDAHPTILSGDLNGDDAAAPGDFSGHGENSYNVVWLTDGDLSPARLDGVTIRGGNANSPECCSHDAGGALVSAEREVVIERCIIERNRSYRVSGAIQAINQVWVYNSRFLANYSAAAGAIGGTGLRVAANCVFAANVSDGGYPNPSNGGGAIGVDAPGPHILHCTFYGNRAVEGWPGVTNRQGGAIAVFAGAATVSGCIFANNFDAHGQINVLSGLLSLAYSEVDGGPGTIVGTVSYLAGNIYLSPNLIDPDGADDMLATLDDDLRLAWGSVCIDAALGDIDGDGDSDELPGLDLAGNPRFFDAPCFLNAAPGLFGFADMGAYELTEGEAAPPTWPDVDLDGDSDLDDLEIYFGCWRGPGIDSGCGPGHPGLLIDVDGDGDVDLHDFASYQLGCPLGP